MPQEAIEAASKGLKEFAYFGNEIASGYADHGMGKIDSNLCQLKNPFEVISFKVLDYTKGRDKSMLTKIAEMYP